MVLNEQKAERWRIINKFRKWRLVLTKKPWQLSTMCNTDVALIIQKDGCFYTFRSIEDGLWPPAMNEIVSN